MRIVILTSETSGNVWLVNQLLSRHSIAGIVVEQRPLAVNAREKIERRRRMLRRYGAVRTMNKLLFNRLRARFLSDVDQRMVADSFFPGGAPAKYSRGVPTVVVPNVNDRACMEFIPAP